MKSIYFLFGLLFALLSWQVTAHTEESAEKFHGKICADDKESAECAQAKEWIRRYHMDLLLHDRDRTMHQGIRFQNAEKKPIHGSIRACVSCHVEKDEKTGAYPAIDTRDHHCAGCHLKAAVKLDCFECHSSKPDKVTLQRLGLDREE